MSLITFLTRIHFADRVLEDALLEELSRLAVRRPMIVCDSALAEGEERERLEDALPLSTSGVIFEMRPHLPVDEDLRAAAALFAETGCDGIIGLGGAATLDLARVLGRSGTPVIAVPTATDGVGLGPLGVAFAHHATRPSLIPAAIFCDATLMVARGPAETAAAGMDALIHCLEAFLSTAFNPPADGIALEGLRRAMRSLAAAVQDGRDIDARRDLLAAALSGGLAEQKGFGGIEAASRGLEREVPVRHGALHAALLPEVLAFNAPVVQDRLPVIRTVLGLGRQADLADTIRGLAEAVGLPVRLSAAGVAMSAVPRAARRAAADPVNQTNPRHATPRDYEAMMAAAL
ncbi:iron-containing alcohol dehydrogenase [Maliponia aquimaris]|uniref:Alcohol dehydrogenase 2 n=1 Tax=Maliponia aquimaris TaxID=1673631 RepID=A0A238L4X5_9RHOB|nr:iron-containing alcohol dehydrogenase [Maliponia aquimaris]SMX49900.1 Alcohol dehydrogenase 2 [Maliponia aquimaris]